MYSASWIRLSYKHHSGKSGVDTRFITIFQGLEQLVMIIVIFSIPKVVQCKHGKWNADSFAWKKIKTKMKFARKLKTNVCPRVFLQPTEAKRTFRTESTMGMINKKVGFTVECYFQGVRLKVNHSIIWKVQTYLCSMKVLKEWQGYCLCNVRLVTVRKIPWTTQIT